MDMFKLKKFLLLMIIFSSSIAAQMVQKSILSEEFLASLPPGERSQLEGNNPAQEEEDLEKLLRSETSVEKNEAILERLKQEIDELEAKMRSGRNNVLDDKKELQRFGEGFFRSIQSSFMPINVNSDFMPLSSRSEMAWLKLVAILGVKRPFKLFLSPLANAVIIVS